MKRLIKLIAASCAALAIAVSCGVLEVKTVSAAIASYDETRIEDDLKDFDLTEYPKEEKGSASLLLFSEYCYSERAALSESYGLYFYVYNPREVEFSDRAGANVVNMAVTYNAAGEPTEYANLPLTQLDETENRRFVKFRLTNAAATLARAKKYSAKHNGERRYDVAGIQLWATNAVNAKDYDVSNTYRCTGYAKGCGANASAESTLACTASKLETISLDIRQTYWRTGAWNDKGQGHQNQVSSVYFAVPKKYQTQYGGLYKVNCEWDEQKTSHIIVTNNEAVYRYNFTHLGEETIYVGNDKYEKVGYVFKSTEMDVDKMRISREQVQKWLEDHRGADYLFAERVDSGRIKGYQIKTFIADELVQMTSFNSTASGWDKFCAKWNELFTGKKDWGTDTQFEPIKAVTGEDFSGTDTVNAKNLMIDEFDYGEFKDFYDANKRKNDIFLLRIGVTDYETRHITIQEDNILGWWFDKQKAVGYGAQETVFLNFDMIELTFKYEGKETVISVVASPINVIGSITPPPEGLTYKALIWGLVTVGALAGVIAVTRIVKRTWRKTR